MVFSPRQMLLCAKPIYCLFLLSAGFALSCPAITQRGWLVYPDGNRISGELTDQEGVFLSDHFGVVLYLQGPASFEPELNPIQHSEISVETASSSGDEDSAESEELNVVSTKYWWLPDTWSVDASYVWKEKDSGPSHEIDLDFSARWERDGDEVTLSLTSKYEYEDGHVDTNEQTGRLRWFRFFNDHFFTLAEGYLERDQYGIEGQDFDYLWLQGAIGPGLQKQFSDKLMTRVALTWNQIYIDLLDLSESGTMDVYSLYAELHYEFSERLHFRYWGKVYFWEDSGTGLESEADINYKLTTHFSIGLKHKYQEHIASLRSDKKNEAKLYTRLSY